MPSPANCLVSRSGSSLRAPRRSSRSIAVPAGEFAIRRSAAAAFLERDFLRALPHDPMPERRELLAALVDRREMVARQLARFAGEHRRAVRKQDLGLADAAGIQQQLAGSGVAGGVLVAEVEVELAEWNPASLAAPTGLDDLCL